MVAEGPVTEEGRGCWLDSHLRKIPQLAWLLSPTSSLCSECSALQEHSPSFPEFTSNLWTSQSLIFFCRSDRHQDPILERERVIEKGVHHSLIQHILSTCCVPGIMQVVTEEDK